MSETLQTLVDEAREIVERRRNSFAAEATYIIDKMIAALAAPSARTAETKALADWILETNRRPLSYKAAWEEVVERARQAPTPSPDIAALIEDCQRVGPDDHDTVLISARKLRRLCDLAAALPSTGTGERPEWVDSLRNDIEQQMKDYPASGYVTIASDIALCLVAALSSPTPEGKR